MQNAPQPVTKHARLCGNLSAQGDTPLQPPAKTYLLTKMAWVQPKHPAIKRLGASKNTTTPQTGIGNIIVQKVLCGNQVPPFKPVHHEMYMYCLCSSTLNPAQPLLVAASPLPQSAMHSPQLLSSLQAPRSDAIDKQNTHKAVP
jgi:hypothetical protein